MFKLFGVPEIYLDNEKILFPYSKINGFIYYLLMEKTVSRSEIAGFLWPEEGEKIAKKNLRNVLYHTKKILGDDIFISPNNTIIELNESYPMEVDVFSYLEDPKNRLDLYEGDFLKGFFIKDSEDFENWLRGKRASFRESFYSTLQDKVREDITNYNLEDVETNLNRLISIDNLDEKNYQLFMTYYLNTSRINKVIETYSHVSKLLKRELNVEPDEETKKIYKLSLDRYVPDDEREDDFLFFGREKELVVINKTIEDYLYGDSVNTIFVQGGVGTGKSYLTNRVLGDIRGTFNLINILSYQRDRGKVLRPIENLLKELSKIKDLRPGSQKLLDFMEKLPSVEEDLSDLDIDKVSKVLIALVLSLSEDENYIFNFEDLNWMDKSSLLVLTSLILKTENVFFFIKGMDFVNNDISDMVLTLSRYKKVKKVELGPFTKDETFRFIKKNTNEDIKEEDLEKIYQESEGVPFYLVEFIKQYKSKGEVGKLNAIIENGIRARFLYLNKEEREILDILSFFKFGIPVSILPEVLDKEEKVVVDLLDKLEKEKVISEYTEDGRIYFKFTHHKVKEYLYFLNSKTKRRFFHKSIGKILEGTSELYKSDLKYFEEIAYHFKESGQHNKEFKYKIEILNHYLNFSHELFPALDTLDMNYDSTIFVSGQTIEDMFNSLREDLDRIDLLGEPDLEDLKMKFYHMKGRYLIRKGRYEEGLEDINYLIRRGRKSANKDYLLQGYKQMIFYYIQTNNSAKMRDYIEDALKVAVSCNHFKEIGTLLRLKGLSYVMVGDYENGEKFLRDSINTFEITDTIASEYGVNIAAAHNYIGEIRLAKKDYLGAKEEFERAIDLSQGKKVYSSLSIFYLNMGKTYFAMEDIKKSKENFILAKKQYDLVDSFWKYPVLNSYLALIEYREGNFEESKKYLDLANQNFDKMGDPRAVGSVNFVNYLLAQESNESKENYNEILKADPEIYRKQALENLDKYRDVFEIERLNADLPIKDEK